jgi:hypothetical protein
MSQKSDAARYQRYQELRVQVTTELYNDAKCIVCGFQSCSNHLHHIEYDAEKSNYARDSKSQSVKETRLREAAECTERFVLLCGPCHRALSATLAVLLQQEPDVFENFIECLRFTYEGNRKGVVA